MKLEHIELDRLSISPQNMRAKKAPDLANILPSIRERGILVPLLVRPTVEAGNYEIVAGRRRFLAASEIAKETGQTLELPCAIMEDGDDAAAIEASLIENVARLDPDEVTQWETFTRLTREGKGIEDIAATFGITERQVRRILALGNLLPRIRNLYRQDLVDAATMRHLTMATKAQQKEWLTLYNSPDSYAPTGQHLKGWLLGGELIATKVALFDLAQYAGPIVSDLFGEDSYFTEPDAFWRLQREAIEAKRQAYLEDGWSEVELIEPGHYFQSWEYEKRGKGRHGRVYIDLSSRGEVEFHEGFLPRREATRQGRNEVDTKPDRPEVTSTLRNYLDLHRHAAVRVKLLDHPRLALRLMIAHAITSAGLWTVRADPQRSDKPEIAASVEGSTSETLFDEKRRTILASLALDPEASPVVGLGRHRETMGLFQRLVELSEEEVLAVASVVMGETLEAGGPVVDELGSILTADMASMWQADEIFFDLIRDRQTLTALVAEVAGSDVSSANAGETGKVLKGIIRDCLSGQNGRPKVEPWVPRWLQFPAATYRASTSANGDQTADTETIVNDEASTEPEPAPEPA